jgi:GNAT superfamily N-acetyltransferase
MIKIKIEHEIMLFGYSISVRYIEPTFFGIGREIAYARFVENGNGTYHATTIFVQPEYRRQGIATEVYKYAEKILGIKIVPAAVQSELGQLFWQRKKWKDPS